MSPTDALSQSMHELFALADAVDEVHRTDGDTKHFRDFDAAKPEVKRFYAKHHKNQTVDFNMNVRSKFKTRERVRMGIWEALELLDSLEDQSDPDTDLSQLEHLLQTAEAMRQDGLPEWLQAVGLVHDLGKLLVCLGSEGQWDVVGDTFVLGCKYSEHIVYQEALRENPDTENPLYCTKYGIYEPQCGLENVMLTWGHDEYLYNVLKGHCSLPDSGLNIIRFHSFYPWHEHGDYLHLMNDKDFKTLEDVRLFSHYDLYSKHEGRCDVHKLKPYYEGIIATFFPDKIDW